VLVNRCERGEFQPLSDLFKARRVPVAGFKGNQIIEHFLLAFS